VQQSAMRDESCSQRREDGDFKPELVTLEHFTAQTREKRNERELGPFPYNRGLY